MTFFVRLDKEEEETFRKKAMERFGYEKGAIKKALQEAIHDWGHKTGKPVKNPVIQLRGMFKDIKESSIQLQKEGMEEFATQ